MNKKLYEKDIEGQDMEPYKTFFVPFDFNKLNLNNINDPVKIRSPSRDFLKRRKLCHKFVEKSH